ncbi:MAP kinase kinase MKK2/SSP33 [Mycena sanguinolenta]|uniref:mitogen-activated protein kinase kinase n=1 Tax=Mycena sanguinolenta TaxID=230812 RepID=A0A8H7DEB6_9AGAR|nr:MAP kinase kinase MKK2/SSP33 [Mycena sanguinolenta]
MTVCTVAWGDDVLEEISPLTIREDGPVHKVKVKHTGEIMVRKTITPLQGADKAAPTPPRHHFVKMLLEFCEGGSLEAVGKRIKELKAVIEEDIAGHLAEGVLQGLAYLHSKKIIHRNIKPSNILLSREGIVKLCDTAPAYELTDSTCDMRNDTNDTNSCYYLAPEMMCGQKYTVRIGVWSAGICLLELVQDRFPFPRDLPSIEVMMYITMSDPPRLEDKPGRQWSNDMKDFIEQMLTLDALTRPTPQDMLAHPWVANIMKQQGQMDRWIREVWGWPRDNSGSSHSDSPPSSGAHTDCPHVSSD